MNCIKLENINKIYGIGESELKALNSINLEIQEKQLIAIVGKSGCGKSTLINIMSGLDTPTSGKVYINDIDIFSMSEEQRCGLRREKVGFIFQSYNLIPSLNVKENILLPSIKANEDYYNEILEVLNLKEREKHLPSELSGGQQQRVAIARALINQPKIIFADEPTGNLDSKSGEDVINLFKMLIEKFNVTILLVTHNKDIAKISDRVITLLDGQVILDD